MPRGDLPRCNPASNARLAHAYDAREVRLGSELGNDSGDVAHVVLNIGFSDLVNRSFRLAATASR